LENKKLITENATKNCAINSWCSNKSRMKGKQKQIYTIDETILVAELAQMLLAHQLQT
jgi:hypothetical protein